MGPFEQQVESLCKNVDERETVVIQRTGNKSYKVSGSDRAGRPVNTNAKSAKAAQLAKRKVMAGTN